MVTNNHNVLGAFLFYFNFLEDMTLAYGACVQHHKEGSWLLDIILVVLFFLTFWNRFEVGRKFRKEFKAMLNNLEPVYKLIMKIISLLGGRVNLIYLAAQVDFKKSHLDPRSKQKKVEDRQWSSKENYSIIICLAEQHAKYQKMVATERQLKGQRASTDKSFVLREEALQVLCYLLLVFLSGTPFTYPRPVAWFGDWKEAMYVPYLSFVWAWKLYSSQILRHKDKVGVLGKIMVFLRTFLDIGLRFTVYFLFVDTFGAEKKAWPVNEKFILFLVVFTIHVALFSVLKMATCVTTVVTRSCGSDTQDAVGFQQVFDCCYSTFILACNSLIVNIPSQRWELDPGDADDITPKKLQQRWLAVRWEYLPMEGLQLVENLLLMAWCWMQLTEKNQELRHYCMTYAPVWIILATLLKVALFETFNRWGHPCATIKEERPKSKID